MVTQFERFLVKANLAKSTVASYLWTINYFLEHYKEVNKKNLLAYKGYLMENFKPQTVNLRAENGGYPPTQNGDIRSLFWLFSLMALQN